MIVLHPQLEGTELFPLALFYEPRVMYRKEVRTLPRVAQQCQYSRYPEQPQLEEKPTQERQYNETRLKTHTEGE
jgi:hypothetical protein